MPTHIIEEVTCATCKHWDSALRSGTSHACVEHGRPWDVQYTPPNDGCENWCPSCGDDGECEEV